MHHAVAAAIISSCCLYDDYSFLLFFPILFNQSQMFLSHLLTPTHQLHVCLHFLCFHSVIADTHTHTVQRLILTLPLCQGLIFMGSVLYFDFN